MLSTLTEVLCFILCNIISAVHSDKSKSNSSVILGVIGHCGGIGWGNTGTHRPEWGV